MIDHTYIGLDLAWSERNPSGLAVARGTAEGAVLTEIESRTQSFAACADWIEERATTGTVIVAIDGPLVVKNQSGMRDCERALSNVFRKHWAGTHSSNRGTFVRGGPPLLAEELARRGFRHAADLDLLATKGRWMLEVYPHPALVRLFDLEKRLAYKKGVRDVRAAGLTWLREQLHAFANADPALDGAIATARLRDARVPSKSLEDQLDAWLCVYIAMHARRWRNERNRVFGDPQSGTIVVPDSRRSATP